jgi:hypothetical protein
MHERYLEITYRRGRPVAAYLYLPRRPDEKSQRSIREENGLIVDIAEGDRPIGIEIVSPNDVSLAMLNEILAKHSLPLLERGELAPLTAVTTWASSFPFAFRSNWPKNWI